MDIIGITGSYESSSVAEILSYDIRVETVSLDDHVSNSFVRKLRRKLRDSKRKSEEKYFIVSGPSIFSHKKLFDIIDHKFYIVDENANDETQKNMPGVVVLESPHKTSFYYRNQILLRLEDGVDE